MPPLRWDFHGEGVLDEVASASLEVREAFGRLMEQLVLNPRGASEVRPLKSKPGGYTAPFDDALLVYQVLADYPRIQLLLVLWDVSTAEQ